MRYIMKTYDCIIVGGGVSGISAALSLSWAGLSTALIDREKEPGRKIYMTGNGRCNFSNLHVDDYSYRSSDSSAAALAVKRYSCSRVCDFFSSLGIVITEKNGYLYPRSNQAKTVAYMILRALKGYKNCHIITDRRVEKIEKSQGFFTVTSSYGVYGSKTVLFCPGTAAGLSRKSAAGYNGFDIVKDMGLDIVTPEPALVPLRCSDEFFAANAGVRVHGSCRIIDKKSKEAVGPCMEGEIQINKDSASGIPVLEISRYASDLLAHGKKALLCINLISGVKKELLSENDRRKLIYGLLPVKLADYFDKRKDCTDICTLLSDLRFDIDETAGFERAQVTAGGISADEININTMELKKISGMYAAGEIIDIDGTCGGYNISFAVQTGLLAAESIIKRLKS